MSATSPTNVASLPRLARITARHHQKASSWPWPSARPSLRDPSVDVPSQELLLSGSGQDYQISQYDEPINVNGHLELPDGTVVGVERAHMKRTPARRPTRGVGTDPLALTTRWSTTTGRESRWSRSSALPDMRTSAQAAPTPPSCGPYSIASGPPTARWRRIDAGRRQRVGAALVDDPFGTRCEIKNLNSVRSLGRAIDYEADRQIALIEAWGAGHPTDPPLDEDNGRYRTLRSKEDAHDYRYFLEPTSFPWPPMPSGSRPSPTPWPHAGGTKGSPGSSCSMTRRPSRFTHRPSGDSRRPRARRACRRRRRRRGHLGPSPRQDGQ